MIELKYFKNIHGRILNTKKNSFVLNDSCIYSDKENNRYCYLTVTNKMGDILLSILFSVRQYDATGQFLKESKFYIPNCYHTPGQFEIDEPIPVERECDAVEVFVERAIFSSKALVNDRVTGIKNVPEPFSSPVQAPVAESIDVVAPIGGPEVQGMAPVAPVEQPVAPAPFDPNAPVDPNTVVVDPNAPVEQVEGASDPMAQPSETPAEQSAPVVPGKGSFTLKKKPFWLVPLLIGIVIVVIFVIVWLQTYGISYNEIYGA